MSASTDIKKKPNKKQEVGGNNIRSFGLDSLNLRWQLRNLKMSHKPTCQLGQMVLDPEHTVYAASHQFKYDSSIFICKFDYPETRYREEESIKPNTGSGKSSPKKKVGSRKIIFQMKKN